MAKDNLFLGMARGKLGDVVFYRQGGQQVSRVRNRSPRNPQSVAQMVQRIIVNTASKAYSMTQDITNHSFEGKAEGMESQQAFIRENVAAMREKCAAVLAYPTIETLEELGLELEHFSYSPDTLPVINEYVMSRGTLPRLSLRADDSETFYLNQILLTGVSSTVTELTYQAFCDALSLQPGDQLTFCVFVADGSSTSGRSFFYGFKYARVILSPDDGDMTKVFVNETGMQNPNSKNEGEFSTFNLISPEGSARKCLQVLLGGTHMGVTRNDNAAMMGVIVSRYSVNKWLRSDCVMQSLRSPDDPLGDDTLYGAYLSYMRDVNSALYLNQADI